MSLVEESLNYFKDKSVVIVTDVETDGSIEEIAGILLGGSGDCLLVKDEGDNLPTVINVSHIAWIYEDEEQV